MAFRASIPSKRFDRKRQQAAEAGGAADRTVPGHGKQDGRLERQRRRQTLSNISLIKHANVAHFNFAQVSMHVVCTSPYSKACLRQCLPSTTFLPPGQGPACQKTYIICNMSGRTDRRTERQTGGRTGSSILIEALINFCSVHTEKSTYE